MKKLLLGLFGKSLFYGCVFGGIYAMLFGVLIGTMVGIEYGAYLRVVHGVTGLFDFSHLAVLFVDMVEGFMQAFPYGAFGGFIVGVTGNWLLTLLQSGAKFILRNPPSFGKVQLSDKRNSHKKIFIGVLGAPAFLVLFLYWYTSIPGFVTGIFRVIAVVLIASVPLGLAGGILCAWILRKSA